MKFPYNNNARALPFALLLILAGAAEAAACERVLGTTAVTEGSTTLDLRLAETPFPLALDVMAEYPAGPLWRLGPAPAACARVVPGVGLVTVIQLHEGGAPLFRIQLNGIAGGRHEAAKVPVQLMAILPDGRPATLLLRSGEIELSPTPLAEGGTVSLTFIDVAGEYMEGADYRPFTLSGAIAIQLQ